MGMILPLLHIPGTKASFEFLWSHIFFLHPFLFLSFALNSSFFSFWQQDTAILPLQENLLFMIQNIRVATILKKNLYVDKFLEALLLTLINFVSG